MLPPFRLALASTPSWLRGLVCLALPGALPTSAPGADYFVSPSGSDASPGSLAAPFATVQHAAETAQPGDTIHLRAGTYREVVEFNTGEGNSGTPGNEIVVKSYQGETAILSAFDVVVPGQNGVGTWTQHAGDVWKITLPASWTLNAGDNLVMVNGVARQEARWPNVPDAFNFDHRQMATSEAGTVDQNSAGPQLPYSSGNDFFTATYTDDQFPVVADGTWTGAYIDLAPGGGGKALTGIVTNNSGTTIEFRYRVEHNTDIAGGQPFYLWNNLAALDRPDEAFLDVEGVSGPPHTLYLVSPEGDPSIHHLVEVRTRIPTLLVRVASHLHFERIVSLGGEIDCRSPSSFITFDRLTARHGGSGLNQLRSRTAVVTLEGNDLALRNSDLGHTFGGGIQAGNTNIIIENNVVRRCQEYGIGTWGGHLNTVTRNTVAENGTLNIAMFSTASQFNHNHCYLAGLHTTDEASMNTNGNDKDMLDGEVAYNWVHDNVGRNGAARGIRMDSGSGGVYNMRIHHNIVWNINGISDLILWALPPTSAAYGNSQIRAYNNTIEGEIKFQGSGSIAGHDIRNNITERLVLVGSGRESATVTNNLVSNQGFNTFDWPGNIFAPPNFVAGALANFYLRTDSAAYEAGTPISPFTDGFSGTAPEIGALEYVGPDARLWSAGAIILPEDVPALSLSIQVSATGQREVLVGNIPEGRVLPDEFALKLGSVVTHHLAYSYSLDDHQATGTVKFLTTPPPEGSQPVSISLDSGTTWIPMGTLQVPPPGTSIAPGPLLLSQTAGGTTATLGINGILSKEKLIPLDILRSEANDLVNNPVPLVVDTGSLIASGELNPDGSNLRVRSADKTVELDYWIESGLDSTSTLIWLLNQPGQPTTGEQLYLALDDPSLPPVSDKSVLTTRYHILEDPSLSVWYSANALAGTCNQGDPVSLLPDLGPRGHPAAQNTAGIQPQWNEAGVAGLPTISFDGNDFLFSGLISPISPPRVSMVLIHRNAINTDDASRMISSSLAGVEQTWAEPGSTEEVFVQKSSRRNGPSLDNFTIGRKSQRNKKYFTGEIAEILVFDEELENGSRWDLAKEYTSRKYALNEEARGALRPQDTVEPATLFLDGQPVTDFTILPDGNVEFVVPPSSPTTLPALLDIEIVSGAETYSLPNGLAYYEPNYPNWAAPLAGAGLDAPTLDLDGDRLENLVEYLCDLDPQNPEAMPLVAAAGIGSGGEDVLHLSFRRSTTATDALLLIEETTDLRNWTVDRPEDLGFTVHHPDPDGDGSAVLYRAELPLPQTGFKFYRLKAELLAP